MDARDEYITQLLNIARSRLESELTMLDGRTLAHAVIQTQKFDMTLKNQYGYSSEHPSGVASVFREDQAVYINYFDS
jgi:hypothetical protein